MATDELWPFFFEVNLIQRRARREKTVFVSLNRNGSMQWTDHSGRFGRIGGIGGFTLGPSGDLLHFRGDRVLSADEEQAERREFSVTVTLSRDEFRTHLDCRNAVDERRRLDIGPLRDASPLARTCLLEERQSFHARSLRSHRRLRAPLVPYLCSLTIDCKALDNHARRNSYEQLKNALVQLNWHWLETSSFFVSSDDVATVLGALELVGKAESAIGGYSHVSYQLQWYTEAARTPSSAANHPNALATLRDLPFPR